MAPEGEPLVRHAVRRPALLHRALLGGVERRKQLVKRARRGIACHKLPSAAVLHYFQRVECHAGPCRCGTLSGAMQGMDLHAMPRISWATACLHTGAALANSPAPGPAAARRRFGRWCGAAPRAGGTRTAAPACARLRAERWVVGDHLGCSTSRSRAGGSHACMQAGHHKLQSQGRCN